MIINDCSKLHRAAACIASIALFLSQEMGILSLEWECADLEWNLYRGERGTAACLLVAVRELVLVNEIRAAGIQMS